MKQVAVIAGPTGSGESTVTKEIVREHPDRFCRLVTATTRPPREGERDGVDYYFFTKDRFDEEEKKGNILESTYIKNRDTYYGTYKPDLDDKLAKGYIVVMNPDLVGAKYYKEHFNATTIFIVPSGMEELEGRLRERNPDMSGTEIRHRLDNAQQELEEEQPFYDHVVLNADGKLQAAVDSVIDILKREGYILEQ